MSDAAERGSAQMLPLQELDIEDLNFVERDLCFYELVSLGFLLFGESRPNAEFVLQKLLVIANTRNAKVPADTDLLHNYACQNPGNWRATLIEALAVIGARRVLRKLGFQWELVRQHYLPHIAELSLHLHPLLKALYKVCERLTPAQAGNLVLQINEQREPAEHLRFYDFAYLEIFLLDWMTRRVISIGDRATNGADVQLLLDYFKLHELDGLKTLLLDTLNSNAEECPPSAELLSDQRMEAPSEILDGAAEDMARVLQFPDFPEEGERDLNDCYEVRREQAGFVLIVNQRSFYEETDAQYKSVLPRKSLPERCGTDVDKRRLCEVFSDFGYTPLEYDNLTHVEVLNCIRETVRRSLLHDSLIVCILSHGIDGAVYGCNSVPVKISDIEEIITAATLQGKPKMLIVQACQKDEFSPKQMPLTQKAPPATYLTPDAYMDMIRAMSTLPGYPSMRHTVTGTWFIQSLCEAVHKHGDRKHMLDILIAVTRDVSNKRGDRNEAMLPITSHTVTKHFYLPRRTKDATEGGGGSQP